MRRIKRFLKIFLLGSLGAWLVACGGGGSSETSTPEDEAVEFPKTPNPLTVYSTLNTGNTAQKTITPQGGSLELILSNGVIATLDFPDLALISNTEVRITEIGAITDYPFSEYYNAAVYIEPEGLRLLRPAKLTLQLTPGASTDNFTGFSFHELGNEFHLYPAAVTGEVIEMELVHFSGYGSGNASESEKQSQRENHPPSSEEDQANQETDNRRSEEALYSMLLSWWLIVHSSAELAVSHEIHLEKAYLDYISWLYSAMANPVVYSRLLSNKLLTEEKLGLALNLAIRNSYERCVSETNLNEIAKMLRWFTWAVTRPEISQHLPNPSELESLVKKCAQFELNFSSLIIQNQGQDLEATTEIEVMVPVELDSNINPYDSETTLQLGGSELSTYIQDDIFVDDPDCSVIFYGEGSTFRVSRFEFNLNYRNPAYPAPEWRPDEIRIWLDIGNPREYFHLSCPLMPEPIDTYLNVWAAGWGLFHKDELDESFGNGFRIEDWKPGIISFAEKIYDRNDPEKSYIEKSTLELKHVPWK